MPRGDTTVARFPRLSYVLVVLSPSASVIEAWRPPGVNVVLVVPPLGSVVASVRLITLSYV